MPGADGRKVPNGPPLRRPSFVDSTSMNDPASSDVLQHLDHQHERLLQELNSLNQRLEQTLGSLGRSSETMESVAEGKGSLTAI